LRDSVSLRDGCDTGAVAPDYGVGQLSAAIHCPATERPLASEASHPGNQSLISIAGNPNRSILIWGLVRAYSMPVRDEGCASSENVWGIFDA
jgi:hypothetical protein